ncbi:hypothetical protein [Streptomyces sp. NRRL F-5123]|uniref:hypothetical protein n=1 Tax=Streptomyces sp. NRRL F-5123 TaxID=1463856 RepID=UPI0004E19FE8|nr:hypothetical protein [Streptomyces sp. NRRL F-5123]
MKSLVHPTYTDITSHRIGPLRGQHSSHPTTEAEAHRTLGANTFIGFTPVVYTTNARGERLVNRDGRPMSIATLHGSGGVFCIFEFQES